MTGEKKPKTHIEKKPAGFCRPSQQSAPYVELASCSVLVAASSTCTVRPSLSSQYVQPTFHLCKYVQCVIGAAVCVRVDLFMRQFERKRLPSGASLHFSGCSEILDAHTDQGFKVLVLDGAARSLLQPHLLARRLVSEPMATVEFVEVAVAAASHSWFTMSRTKKQL